MRIEIELDPKTWWRIAEKAEARGVKVPELISSHVQQQFRPRVTVGTFETALMSLHSRGMDDGEICLALDVTRQRVATVRRQLGLQPNKKARSNEPA